MGELVFLQDTWFKENLIALSTAKLLLFRMGELVYFDLEKALSHWKHLNGFPVWLSLCSLMFSFLVDIFCPVSSPEVMISSPLWVQMSSILEEGSSDTASQ